MSSLGNDRQGRASCESFRVTSGEVDDREPQRTGWTYDKVNEMRHLDKKDVVESCLILDTSAWKQAGILRPGVLRGGYRQWPRALTLGYILDTRDLGKAMLGLLEPTSQAGVFLGTRIPLDTTLTPKGVCASGGAAPTLHGPGVTPARQ